jgi:hypothetical protein
MKNSAISEREQRVPDPYREFFRWCDENGFADVGSGSVEDMSPKRFDAAIAAYAARRDEGRGAGVVVNLF